ncbi:DUF411 domain-containing protein [Marinobacterium arenosum]|uniref:DUF411 domain-containing protein n=1 Tax=Marinobacterium arenosum TaxID=2862496 RepID=UPI001C946612|nr:DUF411 domain-containing protein [Marinobacterium arenosum]MBY4675832.1 DUF411 domain-containing protein [Marinobacterium arenosum]
MKTSLRTLSLSVLLAGLLPLAAPANAANPVWLEGKTDSSLPITVYRSASCGCCKAWVSHLKDHNFKVDDVVVQNMNSVKQQLGVQSQLASCHTAVVNGVVIEGHVPAQDIKRLLASPGKVQMLSVPGMPSGSPGMDMAGAPKHDFAVYALDSDNKLSTFSEYKDY